MAWIKTEELDKFDIIELAEANINMDNMYIVTRYKTEEQGIILLASTVESLIEMIDDTVPEDAIFEVWTKEIEGGDPNEPRSFG